MTQRDPDHARGSLVGWVSAALALLLVAGVAGWQLGWFERFLDEDPQQPTDPAEVAPPPEVDVPPVRRPPAVASAADGRVRLDVAEVEAAVTGYLTNNNLGRDVIAAVAPLGGNSDGYSFAPSGSSLGTPASTTKVVTSAAALFLLGPDHVFKTTTVLEGGGGTPRLVLVGGGDPFLLSSPKALWGTNTAATYAPPKADVVTLARESARSLRDDGVRRVRIGYDDSLFSGPTENPHWRADYIPDDVVSPITSLWVDEGRDPIGYGKVSDPSLTAASVFAQALLAAGIQVIGTPEATVTDRGADEVASVESAPLAQIVQRILEVSDNEAAEVLLRHVGVADQGDGSFVGGQTGVERVLKANDIDMRGSVLYDGSGLSRENEMSPTAAGRRDPVGRLRRPARPAGGRDQPPGRRLHRLPLRPVRPGRPRGTGSGARQDGHPHRGHLAGRHRRRSRRVAPGVRDDRRPGQAEPERVGPDRDGQRSVRARRLPLRPLITPGRRGPHIPPVRFTA